MAHAFASDEGRGGALVGWMEDIELELVIDTLGYTRELLAEPESSGSATTTAPTAEDELFAALSESLQERPAPEDPALRRLLPDAGPDAETSAEFRRLTEDSLRRQKGDRLDVALAAFKRSLNGAAGPQGREVVLQRPEARAAMMALTDARLVLAERLGVHTDEDAEALHARVDGLDLPRNEQDVSAMYYDFITWLAESLTIVYLGQG